MSDNNYRDDQVFKDLEYIKSFVYEQLDNKEKKRRQRDELDKEHVEDNTMKRKVKFWADMIFIGISTGLLGYTLLHIYLGV